MQVQEGPAKSLRIGYPWASLQVNRPTPMVKTVGIGINNHKQGILCGFRWSLTLHLQPLTGFSEIAAVLYSLAKGI